MFKYEEEIERAKNNFSDFYNWLLENGENKKNALNIAKDYILANKSYSQYTREILKKHYKFTSMGIIQKTRHTSTWRNNSNLPIINISCAPGKSECVTSGLYFLGMIGVNPDGEKYYLIKIGSSKCIKDRVNGYACYNPMLYHNDIILPCEEKELKNKEFNCHKYLASMAYAIAQNCNEWFYVNEEIYFTLCNALKDPIFFEMVANGEMM